MANDDINECPSSTIDFSRIERIFAISDLHTDNKDNLSWLKNRCQRSEHENRNPNTTPGPNDILIIAGDISHEFSMLEKTFDIITQNLQCTIFFVPGNHEAWIGGNAMDEKGINNSIQKLNIISDFCSSMDKVETQDRLIGSAHESPVWLVPLKGWYDGTLTLSNCEDLCSDFNNFPWVDFARCSWPQSQFPIHGEDHPNGSIPRGLVEHFIEQNEPILKPIRSSFVSCNELSHQMKKIQTKSKPKGLITFTHFLPTKKVLPDWKNIHSNVFLKEEWLDHGQGGISAKFAKVAGSSLLDDQIRSILPKENQKYNEDNHDKEYYSKHGNLTNSSINADYKHLHVFGHSHRPKDVTISKIRYIHNPLGKPSERELKMVSPNVDFQLIWDCTSDDGEICAKEEIIRYWEEKGGGKEALKINMKRRREKRKKAMRNIMKKFDN